MPSAAADIQETHRMATKEIEFYTQKEPVSKESIDDYDAVLFTVCDVFGRSRGKFAFGPNIQQLVKHGLETAHTTCVLGFHSETPVTLPRYNRTKDTTCQMLPDISTLRPLSWLCSNGRKVGHVLCDLYDLKGHHDISSPRAIALKQLNNLKDLGFVIMTAFEAEYILYHKGTLNPLGGDYKELTNMTRLDTDLPFLYDHMTELLASGIPVETQMEESVPGQIEYSMQPQYGINMADAVHRLRYITKSVCDKIGFTPTFMTKPKYVGDSSGFHFNHSLWTLDGKNAFYDPTNENKCSDIIRHWIAGLIHHGPALTALMNPTVNCFERLHHMLTPNYNIWNYNDRHARLRVKNKSKNIHIEERTPSSACNPYLCLAGLVAAGADGIARKLEAPQPQAYRPQKTDGDTVKVGDSLPKTLEEALQALEQDTILTRAIGEDFIQEYVALCKEFQLEKLKDVMDKEPVERFKAERDLYLSL
uniref:Lengsin n=1 Tax=Arion vulgaris TaxID=1028688 RepID=A0A0B7BF42_9EUPU